VQNPLSRRNDRLDPGAIDKRRECPQRVFGNSDWVNRLAPLVVRGGAGLAIGKRFFPELAVTTRVTASSQPKKFPSKADWELL
jgi:hypothetical protein